MMVMKEMILEIRVLMNSVNNDEDKFMIKMMMIIVVLMIKIL